MVSTREILYVLLISLASGAGYGGVDGEIGGINAYLPLLLLLLFSTDNPVSNFCGCGCNRRNCNRCCGIV